MSAGGAHHDRARAAEDVDRLIAVMDPGARQPLPEGAPEHVLLTGATGYLGIFLLAEVLDRTDAVVHCLVRAPDPILAKRRLYDAAKHFEVAWDAASDRKVRAVPGDLTLPALGLGDRAWTRLARTVDAVYHSGADVNLAAPYSTLCASNVQGTSEVLRLAMAEPVSPVHFVSTAEVPFTAGQGYRPGDGPAVLDEPPDTDSGYALSKWAGERLIAEAWRHGLPGTVHRPPLVFGHTVTGACLPNSYAALALRSFIQVGIYPHAAEGIDLAPVDDVASTIVRTASLPEASGRTFHPSLPHPTSIGLLGRALVAHGYDVSPATMRETLDTLAAPGQPDSTSTVGLVLERALEGMVPNSDAQPGATAKSDPVDEDFLRRCLSFLVRHEFLDPPPVSVPAPGAVS